MFNNRLIAIDIGTYSTKMAAGKLHNGVVTIDKRGITPTMDKALLSGQLVNPKQMAESLRATMKSMGMAKGHVVFSVDSTEVIMRELTVPWAPAAQLKPLVAFEVERYFPVRMQDYVLEYKTVGESTQDGVRQVAINAFAMPKDMVEGYWELAVALGLEPLALEMQSDSVARLMQGATSVNGQPISPEDTVALLDLGHSKVKVSLFHQGSLALTRTLPVGGEQVDRVIALSFDIDHERALEIKHTTSLTPSADRAEMGLGDRARDIIASQVDGWAQAIQPVFRHYLGLNENNRIDRILLYGGSASMGGIAQYLQEAFNRPTEVIEELSTMQGDAAGTFEPKLFVNGEGALIRAKAGDKKWQT